MARSTLVFMFVAALLLSYTMAQSPASSPVATPPRKAKTHAAVSPSAKSPAVSPSTHSAAASPNHPSAAPANSPSSISGTPSEAQGPASSGAFLNRVTVTGSAAVVIIAASLLM